MTLNTIKLANGLTRRVLETRDDKPTPLAKKALIDPGDHDLHPEHPAVFGTTVERILLHERET